MIFTPVMWLLQQANMEIIHLPWIFNCITPSLIIYFHPFFYRSLHYQPMHRVSIIIGRLDIFLNSVFWVVVFQAHWSHVLSELAIHSDSLPTFLACPARISLAFGLSTDFFRLPCPNKSRIRTHY